MALTGDETDDRGPCEELLGSRQMARGGCAEGTPCHCNNDEPTCPATASVELILPIDVAVVADTDPTLQAIRAELRPAVADIDGLLGLNAFTPLVVDVDYPNNRLVVRCWSPLDPTCRVRPQIDDLRRRDELVALSCLPQ
jgi:hypothetical protein